ncbi:MAG: polyprenol monophosphomannose synthase [Candidatus Bathyarchaeia archaeon]
MDITVITPVYNERENLSEFIPKIEDILSKESLDFEIVIVDDNSPDGSGEIADGLKAKYGNIKVLHRPQKMGLGTAYKEGFKLADGRLIVSIDSDLSHDPEILPRMIRESEEADIVIGSRFVEGGRIEGRSAWRDMLSTFANYFIRTITGHGVRDWTSGLRVYRREVWEKTMPKVECIKWDFQFESLYKALLDDFTVKEIPISFHERAGGRSKFSPGEAFYFFLSFFKIILGTKLAR